MKERQAKLIPKYISLRVKENKISIMYRIEDLSSGIHIDDTYINFSPSKGLMDVFEKEIEIAIKNHTKSGI